MKKPIRLIAAGEFKAKCLKLMDEVQQSKICLVVTKYGKPVVTVSPVEEHRTFPYGYMKGEIVTKGDIIGPSGTIWNAEVNY